MLTSSCIVLATERYPIVRTLLGITTRQTLFLSDKEMGSSLSIVVNVIQILSFVVQLLQVGPDLMSRIPDVVCGARAWLRSMMSRSGTITQAWYRADRIIADLHEDTRALEEGRGGAE
jgi:hypothetical protein